MWWLWLKLYDFYWSPAIPEEHGFARMMTEEYEEEPEEDEEEVLPQIPFGCDEGQIPVAPPIPILIILLVSIGIVFYARSTKHGEIQQLL